MKKYPNDSLSISLFELKKLVSDMEKQHLMYVILTANYCRATMLKGSKEWEAAHGKKGHRCSFCKDNPPPTED